MIIPTPLVTTDNTFVESGRSRQNSEISSELDKKWVAHMKISFSGPPCLSSHHSTSKHLVEFLSTVRVSTTLKFSVRSPSLRIDSWPPFKIFINYYKWAGISLFSFIRTKIPNEILTPFSQLFHQPFFASFVAIFKPKAPRKYPLKVPSETFVHPPFNCTRPANTRAFIYSTPTPAAKEVHPHWQSISQRARGLTQWMRVSLVVWELLTPTVLI